MNLVKYSTKKTGIKGELIAQDYLKNLGYKILETNFIAHSIGEIDIIAKDKEKFVFVEVKYRNSEKFGHPLEAVTKTKLKKIQKTIFIYFQQNNIKNFSYRIDAISILKIGDNTEIQHIKNLFI